MYSPGSLVRRTGEVFDDTGKLRTAGYLVDKPELEEMTGLKLEKIETPTADAPALPLATPAGLPAAGRIPAPQLRGSSAIFNKRSVSEASDESELLKAFAADVSPAGKAVAQVQRFSAASGCAGWNCRGT